MRGWTAIAMGLSLLVASGCVETEDDAALDGAGSLDEAALSASLEAEAEDVAVCQALERREDACFGAVTAQPGCAARFACSKQLWRPEVVEEVYGCVVDQPCDVRDPAMACLTEAGAELEPSPRQLEAEHALGTLDAACAERIQVAPGQSDEVYEIIASCVAAEETCDGIGSCVVLSLDTLLADVCGQMETI